MKKEDMTNRDIMTMQCISTLCYNQFLTQLSNERLQDVVNTHMVIKQTIDNFDL